MTAATANMSNGGIAGVAGGGGPGGAAGAGGGHFQVANIVQPAQTHHHVNGYSSAGSVSSGTAIKYGTLVPNRIFVGGIRYLLTDCHASDKHGFVT